jgi:uncharacterized short protein YbdD (DUF466 family)
VISQPDIDAYLEHVRGSNPMSPQWAAGELLKILRAQDARIDELEAKIAELAERLAGD